MKYKVYSPIKNSFLFLLVATILFGCNTSNIGPHASGRFEATEVVVSSEATGKVKEFNAVEGMLVAKGQVLGCIDTVQLHFQKMRLLTGNQAVRARRANVSEQLAAIKQQIKNLEIERSRAEALAQANVGNTKTIDDINAKIKTLEKEYEARKSALEKGNLSTDKEGAAIELQVAQTEDLIKKSIIRAPIDGTIMVTYAKEGEFRATGQPLFRIANLETVFLRAYVSNVIVNELKVGEQAIVYTGFNSENTKEYSGKIVWISQEAEFTPKNIQNRDHRSNLVYAIKLEIANDGYIKPGMYGDVKFNID
ncbi:MAG: efflux RND transporter periplasmic adaptor subunit [Bacteroidales bacterium]|nr:efflux RND transporter periplasmic adaptor subunit [Bacteroidales bacterium]